MTTKVAANARRTAIIPVTTMEEIPVLSAEERVALATSLADAQHRIEAGDFIEYEPQAFKDRLQRAYREAKQAKDA